MRTIRGYVLVFLVALVAATPARAVTLLRDADIEYSLAQIAKPVLRAAGLSDGQIRVLVVDDGRLNAFVVDNNHIFIHSGLLLKLDNARSLQAVIAHEAAHITNGHLTRRAGNLRAARTTAALGLLLSAAAAASGAPGNAAAGVALGTTGSALRNFLGHTRAEESAADISSVRYMIRAGLDPRGALEVQDIFRGQETLAQSRQDPYARSHPLSSDRYRALKGLVAAAGERAGPDPTGDYWFARAKGKLSAFTRNPKWTLRRAKESPSADIYNIRMAAAYHQQSNLSKALEHIDKALSTRPNDPFLHDLKGEILLESRQAGAAVQSYKRAVDLNPRNGMILGGYGRALLASGQPSAAASALERARARDWRDARILRDLAVAYAQLGQTGMASLVTAERFALAGRMDDAALHGKRAADQLPRGSGGWQRAQDVLNAAQQARKRK